MSLFVHLLYCCTQWCSVASVINWSTLQAVIRAVQSGLEQSLTNLTVCTDSQYVLQSANVDLTGQKNMLNWQLIAELQKMLKHKDIEVKLVQVQAHGDCAGNKMADKLAKDGAKSLL